MTDDLSLKSFTSLDRVGNISTYVDALVAFDEIEQLQELKHMARALVAPAASVLDVGCGFGLETLRLAKQATQGGKVFGIDKSADFIAEAEKRAAAAGLASLSERATQKPCPMPTRALTMRAPSAC